MKINVQVEVNVEMGFFDIAGTGFLGCLPEGTTYDDIVRVFGEPQMGRSADGKIQSEWIGRVEGLVFTIYDYKSKVFPKDNTDWHIGGKTKLTAELLKAYFQISKNSP
jgi:hypothetical protein